MNTKELIDYDNGFLDIEDNVIMIESIKNTMVFLIESELVNSEMKTILHGLASTLTAQLDEIKAKMKGN